MSLLLTIVDRLLAEEYPVEFEAYGNGPDTYRCKYCQVEERARYAHDPDPTPRLWKGLQPPSRPFPHAPECLWVLIEQAGEKFLGRVAQ